MDTVANPAQLAFKDRKTELVVFGVILLLMAGFFMLMSLFSVVGLLLSSGLPQNANASVDIKTMVPGLLMNVGEAVCLIVLGIGSIKARRWARALTLTSAWLWLLIGLIGTVFFLVFMPQMNQLMPSSSPGAGAGLLFAKAFLLGFWLILFVIVPGIFVLFYGGDNVKATCEYHDPHMRWTDRCPLPVLALSLISLYGAASSLGTMLLVAVYPLFGLLLTGFPAVLMIIIASSLQAWIAWGLYRLKMGAWWGYLAFLVFGGLSAGLTFGRVGLRSFFELMGYPPQTMAQMEQIIPAMTPAITVTFLVASLFVLGYLVWVRRFFVEHAEKAAVPGPGTSFSSTDRIN